MCCAREIDSVLFFLGNITFYCTFWFCRCQNRVRKTWNLRWWRRRCHRFLSLILNSILMKWFSWVLNNRLSATLKCSRVHFGIDANKRDEGGNFKSILIVFSFHTVNFDISVLILCRFLSLLRSKITLCHRMAFIISNEVDDKGKRP